MAAYKTNCYKCGVEVVKKIKCKNPICDECKKEYLKEYREKNKDEIKEKKKEWYQENKEDIREQQKEYYENNKEERKEYYENNKEDIKEQKKEYYQENKDKIKEKRKEYNSRPKVRQRRKEQQKEYRSRPEVKKRRRVQQKERYKTDPIFKFECCTRVLTRQGFERCALGLDAKSGSTEFYLGCSFKQAWTRFKKQMDKRGMTLNDFLKGRVQIDHIKPRAAFPDLSNQEQAKECFNYKNLQPLWAEENLEKGAKLDWEFKHQ